MTVCFAVFLRQTKGMITVATSCQCDNGEEKSVTPQQQAPRGEDAKKN
jgi:hypothetical protein